MKSYDHFNGIQEVVGLIPIAASEVRPRPRLVLQRDDDEVLQTLLESVSGLDYETLAGREDFEPLAMKSARFGGSGVAELPARDVHRGGSERNGLRGVTSARLIARRWSRFSASCWA